MQPLVVYIDDEASEREAFERAFQSEHHVVATAASAHDLGETRQAAVLAFDAHTLPRIGEEAFLHLAELHPQATRIVVTRPWQQDALAQLLVTACAAWTRAAANARSLSHDLRTPLMSLIADAEHLGVLAEKTPGLRDVADDMLRAARLVQQLVERLGS